MKKAVFDTYGKPDVLQIVDAPRPTIKDKEILIRVKATSVTAADARIRAARFPRGFGFLARMVFGMFKPRVKTLGSTYSGIVEEAGSSVTDFAVGDEVCGMTGAKMGTHAEFIKASKFKSIAKKPDSISHIDAAGLLFGGTAALSYVRDKLQVGSGESVVINGASGAVGTNAVQLARYYGAKITAVTSSKNAKLVKDLGASKVIDYQKQSLATSGDTYDVLLDAVGNISPAEARSLLSGNGRAGLMVASLWDTLKSTGSIKTGPALEKSEDIEFLLKLLEDGDITTVVDTVYDFEDIVAAHERVDTGEKTGNVVLKIS